MGVVIGVDPHKRSNTALVLDANEKVLDRRRFTNDKAGYRELKTWARTWKDRTWAVEGARGVGLSLAQRLAVEGEPVLNVPAKMSAQVRVFGGGSGRRPTTPTRTPSLWPGCAAGRCRLFGPTTMSRSSSC